MGSRIIQQLLSDTESALEVSREKWLSEWGIRDRIFTRLWVWKRTINQQLFSFRSSDLSTFLWPESTKQFHVLIPIPPFQTISFQNSSSHSHYEYFVGVKGRRCKNLHPILRSGWVQRPCFCLFLIFQGGLRIWGQRNPCLLLQLNKTELVPDERAREESN